MNCTSSHQCAILGLLIFAYIRDVSCFSILPYNNRKYATTFTTRGVPYCPSTPSNRLSESLKQTIPSCNKPKFDQQTILFLASSELNKDYDDDDYDEDFDDDFDDDADEDDEKDDDEDEKFQIATAGEDTPLPPLPSFYDDDDDDFINKSGWTATGSPVPAKADPPVTEKTVTTTATPSTTTTPPSSATTTAASPSTLEDETQKRIEQQQQQIDLLMKLVQSQTASPGTASPTTSQSQQPLPPLPPLGEDMASTSTATTNVPDATISSSPTATYGINVAPLKAMMFIDGTWLYYSIYGRRERDCPITRKFGRGWAHRYRFDWSALPRIVCEQMQAQQVSQGWSSTTSEQTPRPVELVRASVFTSMKNDTNPHSFRVKLYKDMADANYDIHMMETVGKGEKCVDIQLAVEMLHYATVPHSYDVAILLSGDKDFMPALIRTRQKGRKVGIVSMRTGCNRALYETPNARDYEVIWIEDYLDQLIVPLAESETKYDKESNVSRFTLNKVLFDFIERSGLSRVSSRDVGRYLKFLKIGDGTMLEEIKTGYGGLYSFLGKGRTFSITYRDPNEVVDKNDKSYWISLADRAREYLIEDAKETEFHPIEKDFFKSYSSEKLGQEVGTESAYFHSTNPNDPQLSTPILHDYSVGDGALKLPDDLTKDYGKCTVAELKDRCRERGLPVSGVKAVLLERVQNDVDEQTEKLLGDHKAKLRQQMTDERAKNVPDDVANYLEGLLCEYLQASGGSASSRDVGRYLAANSASAESSGNQIPLGGRQTALAQLKRSFGGLASFVNTRSDLFECQREVESSGASDYSFQIVLKQNTAKMH